MKKLIFVLLLVLLHLVDYGQGFPLFPDSGRAWITPQLFFAAHREAIINDGIRRCNVFYFQGKNLADSSLSKTIWFDTSGNVTKTIFGSGQEPNFTDSCIYDSKNRFTETRYMSGKKWVRQARYTYSGDTINIEIYQNYYDGDTFYFPVKNKKHVMKVMKAHTDTSYMQKIYDRNSKLVRETLFDNKWNFVKRTEYIYDARGLPLKSYSVDKKKRRSNRFEYAHEFLNGKYTIMVWNDNGIPRPASVVCVYQNNQCIECRQATDVDIHFFYTKEGLLSGEMQTANSGDWTVYKYYYYKTR